MRLLGTQHLTLSEMCKLRNLEISKISKIYRGKDHHCRCGCGGKYYEPGDKGFDAAIKQMSKSTFESYDIEFGSGYINIPYNEKLDRCFCVYFNTDD